MRQVLENVLCFREIGPDGEGQETILPGFGPIGGELYRETLTFTGVFKACYDQYREHDGKPITFIREQPIGDKLDPWCAPIFLVRLPNGEEIEAWPEECTEQFTIEPFKHDENRMVGVRRESTA
jgi:hypothetical protein